MLESLTAALRQANLPFTEGSQSAALPADVRQVRDDDLRRRVMEAWRRAQQALAESQAAVQEARERLNQELHVYEMDLDATQEQRAAEEMAILVQRAEIEELEAAIRVAIRLGDLPLLRAALQSMPEIWQQFKHKQRLAARVAALRGAIEETLATREPASLQAARQAHEAALAQLQQAIRTAATLDTYLQLSGSLQASAGREDRISKPGVRGYLASCF